MLDAPLVHDHQIRAVRNVRADLPTEVLDHLIEGVHLFWQQRAGQANDELQQACRISYCLPGGLIKFWPPQGVKTSACNLQGAA